MASLSRIDSKTTHGWQVKISGARSKLFSDRKHGGKLKARAAAVRWMALQIVALERGARNHQAKGSNHYRARLTEAAVAELRRGVRSGELSIGSWAKRRRVSFSAAYRAAVGQTWKHVRATPYKPPS